VYLLITKLDTFVFYLNVLIIRGAKLKILKSIARCFVYYAIVKTQYVVGQKKQCQE